MEHPLRLLIADDHPVVREGLVKIIQGHSAFAIVGQASDGAEALTLINEVHPDIALLDVEMPKMSGIDVARAVYKQGLPTDIVLLTMHKDPAYFNAALDLGVRGYLLKDSVASELLQSITTVAEGEHYISPSIAHLLVERRNETAKLLQQMPVLNRLTPAERAILRLVSENLTSKEIAVKLGVSPRTVNNHRLRMSQKLELTGHHKLLQFALEHKHLL